MEKRLHPRYQINIPIKLETKKPKTNTLIRSSGKIVDISLGGVGLSLDICLSTGEYVNLWADLHPSKPPLSSEAKVKWIKPVSNGNLFRHGLEFLDPDTDLLKEILREINVEDISECL